LIRVHIGARLGSNASASAPRLRSPAATSLPGLDVLRLHGGPASYAHATDRRSKGRAVYALFRVKGVKGPSRGRVHASGRGSAVTRCGPAVLILAVTHGRYVEFRATAHECAIVMEFCDAGDLAEWAWLCSPARARVHARMHANSHAEFKLAGGSALCDSHWHAAVPAHGLSDTVWTPLVSST
jgi:hypothetical protein